MIRSGTIRMSGGAARTTRGTMAVGTRTCMPDTHRTMVMATGTGMVTTTEAGITYGVEKADTGQPGRLVQRARQVVYAAAVPASIRRSPAGREPGSDLPPYRQVACQPEPAVRRVRVVEQRSARERHEPPEGVKVRFGGKSPGRRLVLRAARVRPVEEIVPHHREAIPDPVRTVVA